jgi:nucleolar MIF4G domain-containing protein 1
VKRQPRVQRPVQHTTADPAFEDDLDFSEEDSPPPKPASSKKAVTKPLKSILKKTQLVQEPDDDDRESSPVSAPLVSRAVKDRLADDDAQIAALEKKLGIKKKKAKAGDDDGLEDLFGDIGASDDEDAVRKGLSKRKRNEDDAWLASKRRKATGVLASSDGDGDSDSVLDDSENLDTDDEHDEELGRDSDVDLDDGFDEDDGFEELGSEQDEEPPKPRVRENPYVAPVVANAPQPAKYIPPALRAPPSSDAEALARLRRQIQGLLNRLSDANLLTILRDIEQIYQNNPRGYVTTTLIDLLLGLLSDETVLPDTFLILHAGFIAATYKVVGTDFGAQMVERLVAEFDIQYPRNKMGSGKQTTSLISVMAELYTFQLIGSNLIFDYIRLFLEELSEINTELLLRIVKVSGSQLRQDDPSSLKDIVLLLQKSVAKVGETNLPVRTKFMIETINNLKNNRMKTGVASSAIVSEHTIRMKKHLGSLNNRNLKGTEPLRIGLADIMNTEKKGKWWLVGASWRNDTAADNPQIEQEESASAKRNDVEPEQNGEVDLLQLAREQRMNTDVRRAIFVTIMSAADFKDAHIRLLKLSLKKSQEMEIPRVIVHCAGCEKTYNPYYTLLARKFCFDHKSRKCFQFALWDVFKSLGEKKEDDDASDDEDNTRDEDTSLRKLVNLGKLYGTLIAKDGLSITSLKPLNFAYLKPKTRTFIEILLVTVIVESQKGAKGGRDEKSLLSIFINTDTALGMVPGLQYFIKKVISKTDITANKAEKETVKWACKVVSGLLTRLMATTAFEED